MVKLVTLFLIGMVVLAMFGKFRFPGQKHLEARKCPECGRYRIGNAPCDCSSEK